MITEFWQVLYLVVACRTDAHFAAFAGQDSQSGFGVTLLQKKVAQCFVLNGVIFLGSILFLQHVLKPATHWLLYVSMQKWAPALLLDATNSFMMALYTWLWLFPAYTISLLVNCLW